MSHTFPAFNLAIFLKHLWNITMVQLVSLMYREQQQGTIRKLINEWLELSLCESSTDDENNTLSSSSYVSIFFFSKIILKYSFYFYIFFYKFGI